ncbi:hypothetical protein EVG20_g11073, partial [Dentipellis fragilis]
LSQVKCRAATAGPITQSRRGAIDAGVHSLSSRSPPGAGFSTPWVSLVHLDMSAKTRSKSQKAVHAAQSTVSQGSSAPVRRGRGRPPKNPAHGNIPAPTTSIPKAPATRPRPRPIFRNQATSGASRASPEKAASLSGDEASESGRTMDPVDDNAMAGLLLSLKTTVPHPAKVLMRDELDEGLDEEEEFAELDLEHDSETEGKIDAILLLSVCGLNGSLWHSEHQGLEPVKIQLDIDSEHGSQRSRSRSASIEPAFPITLQVPVDGALDQLTVMSDVSWEEFQDEVGRIMDLRAEKLHLSYKFSNDTKSELPRCLASATNLHHMTTAFQENRAAVQKSRSKKPLSVTLFQKDVGSVASELPARGRKAQATKGKALAADEAENKPRGGTRFVTALEFKYECSKEGCNKFCWVRRDKQHVKLTTKELSQWGLLISQGKATMEDLPEVMQAGEFLEPEKLEDHIRRSRGLSGPKKANQGNVTPPQPQMPFPFPFYPFTPFPPYGMPYPADRHSPPLAGHRRRRSPSPDPHQFSSDPAVPDEDPAVFPLISDWLQNLDRSNRGNDGTNYSQYIPLFAAHSINRVVEIGDHHSMKAVDLVAIFQPSMPIGHANRIVTFARQEVEVVRKAQCRNTRDHEDPILHKRRRY